MKNLNFDKLKDTLLEDDVTFAEIVTYKYRDNMIVMRTVSIDYQKDSYAITENVKPIAPIA